MCDPALDRVQKDATYGAYVGEVPRIQAITVNGKGFAARAVRR